jgi:hypothetical protein
MGSGRGPSGNGCHICENNKLEYVNFELPFYAQKVGSLEIPIESTRSISRFVKQTKNEAQSAKRKHALPKL